MAVKICLRPGTTEADREAAQRQYETLLRVHDAMGDGGEHSVPRPCLLLAEQALLATEWVAGQSMTALVFSWRCSSTKAATLVARAARWLRHFHACHRLDPGPLDAGEKLAFLSQLQGAMPGNARFARAVEALRASAARASNTPLERSWVHGDFTADNVMVAGARTVGVDIDVRHENTVIHDLAPFLNYLELRVFHPDGWRHAFSVERLSRTFVEAYFQGPGGGIATPLAWLRLYLLLQGWLTARSKPGRFLRSSAVDVSYGTVASRLLKVLESG
jgi:hypothetical protein